MLRNPPLPPSVRSILFICKGNICRSPFAAYLADRISAELKLAVTCHSAGIVPSTDGRCPPEATRAAIRYGVRLAHHVPVGLNRRLAAAHDLIVVMEAGQSAELRRRWPDLAPRLVLLAPYGQSGNNSGDPYSRFNISDPFGKDAGAFDACYGRISGCWRRLLELSKSQAVCVLLSTQVTRNASRN